MRLIINCSVVSSKGSIQTAISIIKGCYNSAENEYHVFITNEINQQINQQEFSNNFHFYLIKHFPSNPIYSFGIIHELRKLEKEINPDCVFTIFGPSYWTPTAPHLIGYALGHYVYPEYFKNINFSLFNRLFFILKKYVHIYFFKRNAEFYYTETNDVSKRLIQLFNFSEKKTFTIGNTYSHVFNEPVINYNLLPIKEKSEFRLITISSYFPHKNLDIINSIIPYLRKSSIKIRFILTLPEKIFNRKFSQCEDFVINLGPVPLNQCPYLYASSDALFLPTLLECFSASYPEAMKMKKPILTSDLSFAHSVCGDAAEYFNPFSAKNIAEKIISLAENKNRQMELISNGEKRLIYFETPESRTRKILEICRNISNSN